MVPLFHPREMWRGYPSSRSASRTLRGGRTWCSSAVQCWPTWWRTGTTSGYPGRSTRRRGCRWPWRSSCLAAPHKEGSARVTCRYLLVVICWQWVCDGGGCVRWLVCCHSNLCSCWGRTNATLVNWIDAWEWSIVSGYSLILNFQNITITIIFMNQWRRPTESMNA